MYMTSKLNPAVWVIQDDKKCINILIKLLTNAVIHRFSTFDT